MEVFLVVTLHLWRYGRNKICVLLLCAPALTGRNGVDCTCYNPRTLGGCNTQGKTRLVPGRSIKLQRMGISMQWQYVSVSICVSVWHVYLRVCAHA